MTVVTSPAKTKRLPMISIGEMVSPRSSAALRIPATNACYEAQSERRNEAPAGQVYFQAGQKAKLSCSQHCHTGKK